MHIRCNHAVDLPIFLRFIKKKLIVTSSLKLVKYQQLVFRNGAMLLFSTLRNVLTLCSMHARFTIYISNSCRILNLCDSSARRHSYYVMQMHKLCLSIATVSMILSVPRVCTLVLLKGNHLLTDLYFRVSYTRNY